MNTIRVKFKKIGLASYFSHLDLQKIMMRAVKKSGLPVWYTQGYNPHIYMTFALPLSLGHESICESFDIKMEKDLSEERILKSLEGTLPDGIVIIGAGEPTFEASDIKYAKYNVTLFGNIEILKKAISDYINSNQIIVTKTTKKASKEINLKSEILNFEILSEKADSITFSAFFPAGNYSLNPSLLLEYFRSNYNIDINTARVLRVNILDENLNILQ